MLKDLSIKREVINRQVAARMIGMKTTSIKSGKVTPTARVRDRKNVN